MISKNLFIKMMQSAEKFSAEIDRWSEFGIDVFEIPIGEIPWDMFNAWCESHFDEEGQDWINWYIFERKSIATGQILACYDENGKEFYVRTLDELWNLVVDHRLKPCLDTPCTYYKTCK